jgi:hypothetical protein
MWVSNTCHTVFTGYQFNDLLGAAVKVFIVELKLSTECVGTNVDFF